MSPEQQHINALASTALGYEGEARTQFLDQACSDNPTLRFAVETLITHQEQTDSARHQATTLLDAPAASTIIQTTLPPPNLEATTAIQLETPEQRKPKAAPGKGSRFVAGEVLAGRYRIGGILGKGGMGEVYRADDTKLGQPVALKFLNESLSQDGAMLARFHGEVRAARQVTHPNVCRVHDIGEFQTGSGYLHFISMEYVDGEDLASLLRRDGRMPAEKALEIARQICSGLSAAHDAGILHRDLKPANIMIDERGRARITDFGLAGLVGQFRGRDVMSGTPAYMSPEQLAGREVSIRSDIYALGLVLYEIFTGQQAFTASTLDELKRKHESSPPPPPSSVVKGMDRRVERIILACLEKDPAQRPASSLQVATELFGGDLLAVAVAAGETPSPEMVAAASKVGRLTRSKAIAALASVVLGLIALLFLSDKASFHNQARLEASPKLLADRAATLVKELGYNDLITDREHGFGINQDYQDFLLKQDSPPDQWKKAVSGSPPLLYFWYRQSPRYLEPLATDQVTLSDPPLLLSGMISVSLDPRGNLVELQAEPPEIESSSGGAPSPAPDWKTLFKEAGLDFSGFKPAEPQWRPPVYSDARAAWQGLLPAPTYYPVRVEAAAYRGKPTYFEIIGAWSQPVRTGSPPLSLRLQAFLALFVAGCLALVAAGVLLARRNLQRGRGHRRGAFKLAVFVFAVYMLSWLIGSSHVPSLRGEFTLFGRAAATAFLTAGMYWLCYIALEPYVRRRWPERIISWSRLLTGGWRDSLVGRDILLGAACGIWLFPFALLCDLLSAKLGRPTIPEMIPPATLLGLSGLIPQFAYSTLAAVFNGLGLFLLLLLTTFLLRREWLSAIALWLLVTVAWGLAFGHSTMDWIYFALATGMLTVLLLRLGLLVFIIADFYLLHADRYPFTFDFSAWYAPYSHLAVLTALAIAGYGFYVSLAGHPLFHNRPNSKLLNEGGEN